MSGRFQELDWRPTPLGEISLRRRWDPALEREVYEIKLGDEFLMSSAFTVAETELARLALTEVRAGSVDVAVGGLGLGHTARAALADHRVASLVVVEALDAVIGWHERGLVPGGAALVSDPRCRMVHGDFFALLNSPSGLDPATPDRKFHAIIVDIDHSPRHLLRPGHAAFYRPAGLQRLAGNLVPGGVFALWSNDPPDRDFTGTLGEVFRRVRVEVISFRNRLRGGEASNTVYLAGT